MDGKRKLRILQINKLYDPYTGGIESVVKQIAEGLQTVSEMQVLVCNTERRTIHEIVNGVKVTRTGSIKMVGNLPLSISFFIEFRKQAKKADILLFHMPFPIGDFAYWLSGIRKKKVIVWWHSDIVRQKKLLIFYQPLMHWFLKKADRIVVATKGHIEGSAYLKSYREKCVVIPFGVRREIEADSRRYLKEQEKRRKAAADLDSSEDRKIRFLFVGRLVYYKGCDILVHAFKRLSNAELMIGGSGTMKEELKARIAEYQIAERVIWKEKLSDQELMKAYRDCDVLVLPSVARSEAFGLVQIEAMAYGKPVINTDLPSGVPYVSIHGETGLTVKPGDVTELYQAMEWMIQHPKERKKMGIQARKRVEQEYLSITMMERLEKLFQEVEERNQFG